MEGGRKRGREADGREAAFGSLIPDRGAGGGSGNKKRKTTTAPDTAKSLSIASFFSAVQDQVLIVEGRSEGARSCLIYTKAEYDRTFGRRPPGDYAPLLLLIKDGNGYVRTSELHGRDAAAFDARMGRYGLPGWAECVRHDRHGAASLPDVIARRDADLRIGMWHESTDADQRRAELAGWAAQYGADNLAILQCGSYAFLNKLERDEHLAAPAERPSAEGLSESSAAPSQAPEPRGPADFLVDAGAGMVPLWHAHTDFQERLREIAEWGEAHGKGALLKRQPDGSYSGLDARFLSEAWTAAADFMVMEGWPRVAVRGPDDCYTEIMDPAARYSSGDKREILILSEYGDGYHSPYELDERGPDLCKAMMSEAGLAREVLTRPAKSGPEWLLCDRQYRLLGGAAYAAPAAHVPDECKLVRRPGTGSFQQLRAFVRWGEEKFGPPSPHRPDVDAERPELRVTTIETRARAILDKLSRAHPKRERQRSR